MVSTALVSHASHQSSLVFEEISNKKQTKSKLCGEITVIVHQDACESTLLGLTLCQAQTNLLNALTSVTTTALNAATILQLPSVGATRSEWRRGPPSPPSTMWSLTMEPAQQRYKTVLFEDNNEVFPDWRLH